MSFLKKWLLRAALGEARRMIESELAEFVASGHLDAVLETLAEEFPPQKCEQVVRELGWDELRRRIAKRACERLIEHIL